MGRKAEDGRLDELEKDHKLRGSAIEIVAQLPSDKHEALLVLEYARELVENFLPGRISGEMNGTAGVCRLKPVA